MTDFAAHTARMVRRVGQAVTVTPSSGPARTITAVWTAAPAESLGINGFAPQVRAVWSDVSDLVVGNPVSVGGATYQISSIAERDRVSSDVVIGLESV